MQVRIFCIYYNILPNIWTYCRLKANKYLLQTFEVIILKLVGTNIKLVFTERIPIDLLYYSFTVYNTILKKYFVSMLILISLWKTS